MVPGSMYRHPPITTPHTESEREQRIREVRLHSAYLRLDQQSGEIDRIAAESSYVVRFYDYRLRRDVLAARRYLWSAREPPFVVDTHDQMSRLRQQARIEANYPTLDVDILKARRVDASDIGRRWTETLLGNVSLLLAARSGLPAGLTGVWYSVNVVRQAGTQILNKSLAPDELEAALLKAAKRHDPWKSEDTTSVTLRVFAGSTRRDIKTAYEAARKIPIETGSSSHASADSELAFSTHETFHEDLPCLEMTVSTTEALPEGTVLVPWFKACVDKHRNRLKRGPNLFIDEVLRLWTTSAFVDFADLSNRDAMSLWDSMDIPGTPRWSIDPTETTTQSAEISFTNSRREVFNPRREFYLSWLKKTLTSI